VYPEGQAGVDACFSEIGVLREKAVPRMDGFGATCEGYLDYLVAVEVAFAGVRRADKVRLIGVANMAGELIDL
jgi:hypothetical protein